MSGAEGGNTRTSTPRAWTKGLPQGREGKDHIISELIATATTKMLWGAIGLIHMDHCFIRCKHYNGQSSETTGELAHCPKKTRVKGQARETKARLVGPIPQKSPSLRPANKVWCLIGCSTGRSRNSNALATEPQRQLYLFHVAPATFSCKLLTSFHALQYEQADVSDIAAVKPTQLFQGVYHFRRCG